MTRKLRWVPITALLVACAPAVQSAGLQPVVTERLYFGRNVAHSLGVTDSAWAGFVREVITTRLTTGFTFWAAEGEWRAPDGRVVREPSFVLEIVRPQSASVDSAIVAIIGEYKRRFKQESVLRVVTPGRASF